MILVYFNLNVVIVTFTVTINLYKTVQYLKLFFFLDFLSTTFLGRTSTDALREPLKPLTTSTNMSPGPSSESQSPEAPSPQSQSSDYAFSQPKTFNIPGLSLPALASVQIKARNVVLHRNVAGNFLNLFFSF